MRPMRIGILLSILALVSLSFAFPVNNYLYYGEEPSQVVYEKFIYAGSEYTLVTVNDKEIFLLQADVPIENKTQIRPVLQSYYRTLYYPDAAQLERIRELLKQYNDSRNNGETLPGKEESTCRQILFLDGHIHIGNQTVQCIDDESCELNAALVYQAYRNGAGFSDPAQVKTLLQPFAYASNSNEEIMYRSFEGLDTIDDATLESSLQYILDNIPTLRDNFDTIRYTPLRTPLNNNEDRQACIGTCFAMCPAFDFDMGALDTLETETTGLLDYVRPYAQHVQRSAQIENETTNRLRFRDVENQATYYYGLFVPLKENATAAVDQGEEALSVVLNLSLKAKVDRLKELTRTINQSLERRNFTAMNDYFTEYEQLTRSINQGIPGTLSFYERALDAKRDAATMLLLLETRDLGSQEHRELQELQNVSLRLDAILEPGLTSNDYNNITHTYEILTQRVRNVLKSQDENPLNFVSNKFRGMGRRVGRGIAEVLRPTAWLPTTPETTNSVLLAFAGLAFVGLSSLSLFLTLTIFSGMQRVGRANTLGGMVVVGAGVILALLLSGSLYYFIDKSTQQSMLDEFLFDLASRGETLILVDATRVSVSVSGSMLGCAGQIADALRMQNKTVQIYQFQQQSCLLPEEGTARNVTRCGEEIDAAQSLFVLNYSSPPQTPAFHSIFVNRMDLSGDRAYYQTCSIAQIFEG